MRQRKQQVVWDESMTWWRLAEQVYGEGHGEKWVLIVDANPHLGNPARVQVGTVLTIPVADEGLVGL